MKTLYRPLYFFFLLLILGQQACKKPVEDLNKPILDLGGLRYPVTELDTYLQNIFDKYNIRVVYRWDGNAVPSDQKITPVNIQQVKPIMDLIKQCWIDPYEAVNPDTTFLMRNNFRQIVLVGGPYISSDNTMTLATAEGGMQIVYYNLNALDITNMAKANNVVHIFHHEFTHILNQRKKYPVEFDKITPGYDTRWANKELRERLGKGFICPYASHSPQEDFAEMVAISLAAGAPIMQYLFDASENTTARAALMKKMELVKKYFNEDLNVDFNALQKAVNQGLKDRFPSLVGLEKKVLENMEYFWSTRQDAVTEYMKIAGIYITF